MNIEKLPKCPYLRNGGICGAVGELPQYAMERAKPIGVLPRTRVCTAVPDAERIEECRGNPILYLKRRAQQI